MQPTTRAPRWLPRGLSGEPAFTRITRFGHAGCAPSATPPHAEMHLPLRMSILRSSGAYAAGEAAAAARTLLPDTLRYHRGWLAALP
jgi:hypothetical protein